MLFCKRQCSSGVVRLDTTEVNKSLDYAYIISAIKQKDSKRYNFAEKMPFTMSMSKL